MQNHFYEVINKFKDQRVLIIGEAFLDMYLHGFVERISREAPIPIVDLSFRENAPGGAANTAKNIAALGAQAIFLSVVGKDDDGKLLIRELSKSGVYTSLIISDKFRETMTKKRVLASQQMLLRFDCGTSDSLSSSTERQFIDHMVSIWEETSTVIVSDYGYGIITPGIISILEKLQKALPRTLIIDSKYLDKFSGISATVVKPNYNETTSLLGLTKIEHGEKRITQIVQNKDRLFDRINAKAITVTLDTEGALIFDRDGTTYRTYADIIENPQVAGAGDTYTAVLSLCLAAGSNIKTAAEVAAAATKIVIKKSGTAICTLSELQTDFSSNAKFVTDRRQLRSLVNMYRDQGKKIVLSNGCFDILHSGHVAYLNKAKSYGDILILGINTDKSIRALKGNNRPINSIDDRMHVLSALSCIDYVVPLKESTACNLVKIVKPDVYVKGGDYLLKNLPEARFVERFGGSVKLIPIIKGKSTTDIINRIQKVSDNSQNLFL